MVVDSQVKGSRSLKIEELSVAQLEHGLRGVCEAIGRLFADVRSVGGFELTEVSVGVGVDAKAGFHIVGTAEAGANASISLKFERPKQDGV